MLVRRRAPVVEETVGGEPAARGWEGGRGREVVCVASKEGAEDDVVKNGLDDSSCPADWRQDRMAPVSCRAGLGRSESCRSV